MPETGASDPSVKPSKLAAQGALKALLSLMEDCALLQEMLLQWMSSSRTARQIDRELGDLGQDLAGSVPALSYLRYNVDLGADSVRALDPVPPEANRIASSERDGCAGEYVVPAQAWRPGGRA
jgi:hypothetical protein